MGDTKLDDKTLSSCFKCYVKGTDQKKEEWFKKSFHENLWTIYYWQTGKLLVNKIIEKTGVTDRLSMEYWLGSCGYKDNQKLYWDPQFLTSVDANKIIEPTQTMVVAQKKEYIYLFHELVHYLHDLSGTFKKRGDQEEEFQTVGLYEYSSEQISENALRQEAKLPRRPCYYYSQSNPEETKRRNDRQLVPDVKQIRITDKECKFPYVDLPNPKGGMLRRQSGSAFAVRGVTRRGARPLGST